MSAPAKVVVTMSAAGATVRLSYPLELFTAALYECGERLAGADDARAAELALTTMAGIGGIDLIGISEAFTLAAWADQLEESDVTSWDACAQRAADIFGAESALAGAEVSQ